MKIVTILGARPQFIKAGTVSREIAKYDKIEEIIVHTGQHFDKNMSDVFFDEMKIPKPQYNLNINGLSHGAMTGQMLEKIEEVLLNEKPDWVLVYGDTNSTLAGGLAASKLHIKVAHIEAGLRSFNRKMPEEINRVLTDHVSSLLFSPTDTAAKNLENEGIRKEKIKVVGDVMYDAALYYGNKAKKPEGLVTEGDFILSTIHRAENTDNPKKLISIIQALNKVASQIPIVFPLHPRTRKLLRQFNCDTKNIILLEPVGYLQMVWLLKQSILVVTDSGGLQKEAYFFGKHCVTVREETEWVELIKAGINTLSSTHVDELVSNIFSATHKSSFKTKSLFGDGYAKDKIIRILLNNYEQ